MWFKYGLKAQKLQKQHALKGQKLLGAGLQPVLKPHAKVQYFIYFYAETSNVLQK